MGLIYLLWLGSAETRMHVATNGARSVRSPNRAVDRIDASHPCKPRCCHDCYVLNGVEVLIGNATFSGRDRRNEETGRNNAFRKIILASDPQPMALPRRAL